MGLAVVLRCLDEAQHRTLGAAMAQLRGLKRLAQRRGKEVTRKQRLGLLGGGSTWLQVGGSLGGAGRAEGRPRELAGGA